MSNINNRVTISPVYDQAKDAIREVRQYIKSSVVPEDLTFYVQAFEDIVNGLSGEILKLEKDLLSEIRLLCRAAVDEAAKKGVEINLFVKLLPDPVIVDKQNIKSVQTKKLYPLTYTVTVEDGFIVDDASKSRLDANGAPSGINNISNRAGSELSATISQKDQNNKSNSINAAANSNKDKSTVAGLGDSKADDYDSQAIAASLNSAAGGNVVLSTGETVAGVLSGGANAVTGAGASNGSFGEAGFTGANVDFGVTTAAEIEDELDADFDTIDDEAAAEAYNYEEKEPMVYLPEELLPIVSSSLLELINQASSNANGLQAGLTAMFTNPLAAVIEETKNYVLALNGENYAGLNAATGLSSGTNYAIFRDAMGGGDGFGGIYAQLEKFRDHTDRLSGLVVDENSENAEPGRDNTVENFEYFGLPLNTPTTVLSFDAKKFRSAKYYVQATAQTEHQMSELFVLHDTKNAFFRQVDTNYTIDPFISFTSSFADNTVNVIATTTVANTDLVINSIKFQIVSKAESYEKISLQKMLQMHETLNAFYRDGTNYLGNMANSLTKLTDVVRLRQQIVTSVNRAKSGGNLITQADALSTAANVLQSSIDSDYAYYRDYKKKHEAIELSYLMARNYNDDPNVKSVLDLILNTSTKEAIAHTPELDEFDEEDIIDEYLEEQGLEESE